MTPEGELNEWPEDAEIDGDGTVDEESEYYAELNRGYSQDRI